MAVLETDQALLRKYSGPLGALLIAAALAAAQLWRLLLATAARSATSGGGDTPQPGSNFDGLSGGGFGGFRSARVWFEEGCSGGVEDTCSEGRYAGKGEGRSHRVSRRKTCRGSVLVCHGVLHGVLHAASDASAVATGLLCHGSQLGATDAWYRLPGALLSRYSYLNTLRPLDLHRHSH